MMWAGEASWSHPDGRRSPTSLADTIDAILDRGLVIDGFVRCAVIGAELPRVDMLMTVTSADTFLRLAEAVEAIATARRTTSSAARGRPRRRRWIGSHS